MAAHIILEIREFATSRISFHEAVVFSDVVFEIGKYNVVNINGGKTGADWDSAPEQTGTLLMLQS